jgi:PAS domain S-box-containing protein
MSATSPPAPLNSTLPAIAVRWQPVGWAQWLLLNALLSLLFFAVARLGLWASLGPGETSAVWPPSGFALAALLGWGPGALPGLVLGSWVNDAVNSQANGVPWGNAVFYGALLTGAGTSQWLIVRALVGNWSRLLALPGPQLVLRFAASVLVGGLLAPSLGVPVLLASAQLARPDVASAWLTWWMGDVNGMLLFTPLLLMLLNRGMRRQYEFNQAFPALTMGLGLTLVSVYLVGQQERAAEVQRADTELRALTSALQAQVDLAESDLRQLAALHFRIEVTESEFQAEADLLRRRHDWLTSLSFIRRVAQGDRARFEAESDRINALQSDGGLATAPVQSEYWVTQRISPTNGHEARIGLDESSDPLRLSAIELAVRTGEVGASAILDNLTLSSGEPLVVALYQPVYQRQSDRTGAALPVTGVVSAGLQLQTLLATALQPYDQWRMPLLLVSDDREPRGLGLQDDHITELPTSEVRARLSAWQQGRILQRDVRLGQRQWQLVAQPHSRHPLLPSPVQWGVLLTGLVFTGLLGAMLVARARRDSALRQSHAELERLVGVRTEALAATNADLERVAQQRQELIQTLSAQAKELAQREAVLNAVLRSIPDPLWVKDNHGRFLQVNTALERALHQTADRLVGHMTDAVFYEHDAELDREADEQARRSPLPITRTQHDTDAEGRRRTYWVTRSNVRHDDGTPIGLIGIARDVTEQLAREDELRRFRWLAESAAQGFALGQLDGAVDYLNGTAQRWLGEANWPPAAPRLAREYYDEAGLARLRNEVMPALRKKGDWSGEMAVRGLPGATMPPVWVSYFMLRDEQGHERAVAMTMTDISERRRFEAELADARDRAEAANRAKSVFLANMSHEIRTPLNAVLGYAQLLREQPDLGEASRHQVASILGGGQRLLRLINDVLDLSKIEAGALQLRNERFDLPQELAEALRLMAERARHADVALVTNLDLPPTLPIMGDRGKLGQVLLNLLGNALKFTPPGGSVTLTAGLRDETHLTLSIRDTGPGIAPAELQQLFTPFVQGSTGLRQGGTGLGLVLSRNLLRAMGGELSLSSELGGGTEAHVELPLQRVTEEMPTPTADASVLAAGWRLAVPGSVRVLVAEDDPDSRAVLCALLSRIGCQVMAGENGAEALALSTHEDVDLVLTDLRMPVLDGVGLMQALRDDPRRRAWPVVAVTASSMEHEREVYLDMGFSDYIPKPYEFVSILQVLRDRAGAHLVPPAGSDEGPPASAPSATVAGGGAAWAELIGWAQDGDVAALRAALQGAAGATLPTPVRAEAQSALARYDFDALVLLFERAQAAPPENPA